MYLNSILVHGLVVVIVSIFQVQAALVTYNLTITFDKATPNCFGGPQVLINGMSPGPVIRARENDTLRINVFNKLPKDEFTLHYHGLHQKGTPYYDGVPNITQIAIDPGQAFSHIINLENQSGTFLYHSHTKLHATTAMGAIVIESIEPPPFKYDEELLVLLSDRIMTGTRFSTKNEIEKMSYTNHALSEGIWFNGHPGITSNSTRALDPGCKPNVYIVDPNKTYRLRLISATTVSYASFAIAGHILEVVEVEGFYTAPTKLDKIPLHSGQRYSILIKTKNTARQTFRMHTHTIMKDGTTKLSGVTHMRYSSPAKHEPTTDTSEYKWSPSMLTSYSDTRFSVLSEGIPLSGKRLPFDTDWPMDFRTTNLGIRAASNLFLPYKLNIPPKPTKRYVYRVTHEERDSEETPRWFVNNVTLKHPPTNLLAEAYRNNTHSFDGTNFQLDHLNGNEIVEIVIQNTVDLAGVCDNHPWHLHGHSFWDMGSGLGKYDPDTAKLNPQPILRDTFTFALNLPQSGLTAKDDCGWHVIRFHTNNPGLWIFHCHILQHMDYGMVIYFMEDTNNLPPLPSSITNINNLIYPIP